MNLDTLEISQEEAKDKLDEYQQALHGERTAEDAAIAAGYRAAARGLPILSLPRTVAAGGFHGNGLPRIAVIRADVRQCFARWDGDAVIFADTDDWRANQGALVNRHSVRVTLAGDGLPDRRWRVHGSTMVPLIPPRFRPSARRLRGHHILWEVEEWTSVPPRDPALLKHIRGDLWAVLAVWDLTELERLVLTQRRMA
jgi:hypothetical protein